MSHPVQWERTALHSASMSGHTEVVEMLLHTDLYINDQDQVWPSQNNPLYVTYVENWYAYVEMAFVLTIHETDISYQASHGVKG